MVGAPSFLLNKKKKGKVDMQLGRWGSVDTSLVKSFAGQISQKLSVKKYNVQGLPWRSSG